MYVNFELFNHPPEYLYYLIGIKQGNKELLNSLPEEVIKYLDTKEYIARIKGTNKNSQNELIRLSKKGKDFLESLSIPIVEEGDIKMANYLFEMYLNHEDKDRVIGNKKLVTQYISILRHHLNLDLTKFYYLCDLFLKEYSFTKKLENIFLNRNKNRYGDFKNCIDDSVLYQFYEDNKESVIKYWDSKIPLNSNN
jgi:hypothetical protein